MFVTLLPQRLKHILFAHMPHHMLPHRLQIQAMFGKVMSQQIMHVSSCQLLAHVLCPATCQELLGYRQSMEMLSTADLMLPDEHPFVQEHIEHFSTKEYKPPPQRKQD